MLSKLSVKRPFTVIVAVIISIVLGVVAYIGMKIDLLPDIELPYVVVMTTNAGASPEEIEQGITDPLESTLATTSGVESVYSVSAENYSMVILQLASGTNMDGAMIEISSSVDMAATSFPDGVAAPIILRINPDMMPVMVMAADKDGMDEVEFSSYVENTLIPSFERIEGVASVTAMGIVTEQIDVIWDEAAIEEINDRILPEIDGELAKAKQELDSARKELAASKSKLDSESDKATQELSDAAAGLADARSEIQDGFKELDQAPDTILAKITELTEQKATLQSMYDIFDAKDEITAYIGEAEQGLAEIEAVEWKIEGQFGSVAVAASSLSAIAQTIDNTRLDMNIKAHISALTEDKKDILTALASYDAANPSSLIGSMAKTLRDLGAAMQALSALSDLEDELAELAALSAALGSSAPSGSVIDATLIQSISTQIQVLSTYLAQISSSPTPELLAQLPENAQECANLAESTVSLLRSCDTMLASASSGAAEMAASMKDLNNQKNQLERTVTELKIQESKLDSTLLMAGINKRSDIDEYIRLLDEGIAELYQALEEIPGAKEELEKAKKELDKANAEYEKGKLDFTTMVVSSTVQLATAEAQLDSAYNEFEAQREEAFKNAGLSGALTPASLAQILAANNMNMPAGYIEDEETSILVKVGDKFSSVDELAGLLLMHLDVADIGDIFLQDVAEVTVSNDAGEYYAKVNGNPGVILSLSKQSMASTSEVSERINDLMESLTADDDQLHLTSLSDQGFYIRTVIDSVVENLILGGILAIIILLIFLRNLRPTLIVAVSIPISLMCAIALMYFSGVSINVISMAGLAMGVGMLVDNSIVVIENIFRLRQEGYTKAAAAYFGAKEMSGAIIASTLTTVCVFVPIVFTQGLSRQLFMDMGLTVAYSLLASLLVALSVVPMAASRILKEEKPKERRFFTGMVGAYTKSLSFFLKHKAIVFVLCLGLAVFAGASIYFMGFSFIPEVDYGQINISVSAGEDSTEEEDRALADEVVEEILKLDGIQMVGAMDSGGFGLSMGSGGAGGITIYVLLDVEKSFDSAEKKNEISSALEGLSGDIVIDSSGADMTSLMASGIEVIVEGDDSDKLRQAALDIAEIMEGVEGLTEIDPGIDNNAPEIRIIVDKNKAMAEGLTVAQIYQAVARELTTTVQSISVSMDSKSYDVVITDKSSSLTPDNIGEFSVDVSTGSREEKSVRLKNIADIEWGYGLGSISHVDQQRSVSVSAKIADDYNVTLVSRDLDKALNNYQLPAGCTIDFSGENETINDIMGDLALMILLAVIFIYLIMVAQFQSMLSPFIILFTVPLAFTGGILALMLFGYDLSVVAMLGMLILAGVIVNNGIVFVDCVNRLRLKGMERRAALLEAGRIRLRPILMTALTTIFGLVTMAVGAQMGAEMLQPLAVTAIGGLVYATFLTLFLVPALYDVFCRKELKEMYVEGEEEIY